MLGSKIQQLRKSNGMSQEELASKLTISRQAISKWELGESMPDTENIVQLSKLFGVTTDFLLIDKTENENDGQEERAAEEGIAEECVAEEESAEAGTAEESVAEERVVEEGAAEEYPENILLESSEDEISQLRKLIQRIKQYAKKPAFWIIAATIVVALPLCVLLITGVLTPSEEPHAVSSPPATPPTSVTPSDSEATVTPLPDDPTDTLPELSPSEITAVQITYADRQMTDFTLKTGEMVPLRIKIEPTGFVHGIEWSSSDSNIFSVIPADTTGLEAKITGIGAGVATLFVNVGSLRAECTVRVSNN